MTYEERVKIVDYAKGKYTEHKKASEKAGKEDNGIEEAYQLGIARGWVDLRGYLFEMEVE